MCTARRPRIVQPPPTPAPVAPPPEEPEAPVPPSAAQISASQARRRRLARARTPLGGTVLTGPRGVPGSSGSLLASQGNQKTLLGS